jgi:transposase-like protein
MSRTTNEIGPAVQPSTTEGEDARTRPGRRSVEDRQAAVLGLFAGKATVDQLARRLGGHPETIEQWHAEALSGIHEAFAKGSKSPKERELERENRQLRDAVTEGSIREAVLKRELEAARGTRPTRRAKSRR